MHCVGTGMKRWLQTGLTAYCSPAGHQQDPWAASRQWCTRSRSSGPHSALQQALWFEGGHLLVSCSTLQSMLCSQQAVVNQVTLQWHSALQ
jgi:hypothetical protein